MDEYTEGKIKKLKNLRMFRDKTDEQIIEYLKSRPPKIIREPTEDRAYNARFAEKFESLKNEYEFDMNDSNDIESLSQLVRHMIQAENIDKQIIELQAQKEYDMDSSRLLKNLGDFQRTVLTSITELQDRLGITRKIRKERQIDDIPQYIGGLKKRAKEFFDRKTISIRCNKCEIEYARFWLNFPQLTKSLSAEIECWHCHEAVIFAK